MRVKFDPNRQPHHVVVSLTDPLLFRCPLLFMEDIGTVEFSPDEVLRLREYFMKGGFLWVDDSWGSNAWNNWISQVSLVLPPAEFPVFDIPPTHAIMRTLYDVKEVPAGARDQLLVAKRPAINFGAGGRQRAGVLQGHSGLARPPDGRHDPQHRHRGYVGA